ncbi:MAG: hypothetical protein EOM26_11565 [Alphaproteobacteria bacterium]|nr:hypothetical protein [Alphaproteobacteria bacterium]
MLKNFYDVPYEDFFRDLDPPDFPDAPDDDPVAKAVFWKIASIEDADLKRKIRKIVNLLAP